MNDASEEITLYVIPACHPNQAELTPENRQEDIAFRLGGIWNCAGRPRHQWTMRIGPGVSLADRTMLKIRFASRSAKRLYEREMGNWKAPSSRALTNNLSERFFKADAPAFEPAAIAAQKRVYFFTSTDRDSPFYYRYFDRIVREKRLEVGVDHRIDPFGRRCWSYGLRYVLGDITSELTGYRSLEAREAFFRSRREEFETLSALRVAAQLLYDRPVAGPLQTLYGAAAQSRSLEKRPLFLPKKPGRQAFGTFERQVKARERAEAAITALPRTQLAELLDFTADQARLFLRFKERTLFEGNDIGPQEQAYLTRIQEGARFARDVLLSEGHAFALQPRPKTSPAATASALRHGIITDAMNGPDFIRSLPYLSSSEDGSQVTNGRDIYGVYLSLPAGLLTIEGKDGSPSGVKAISSTLARASKHTTEALCVMTRIVIDEEVRSFVYRAPTLYDAIHRINADKALIEQQVKASSKSNPTLIPTIVETIKVHSSPKGGIQAKDFIVFKVNLFPADSTEEVLCVASTDRPVSTLESPIHDHVRSFFEQKLGTAPSQAALPAELNHMIVDGDQRLLEVDDPLALNATVVRFMRETPLGNFESFGVLSSDGRRLVYTAFDRLVDAIDQASRKRKTQSRRATISLPSD